MSDRELLSRGRFIKLGGALGVGAASASLLAGCGGGESGSAGNGSGGGDSGGSGSGQQAIARESEVQPGSATKFQNDGEAAVLVHLEGGDFVAYSAVCTHQGCEVAYNEQEGTLNCPCHGSVFDPADGASVERGPAEEPLPEIPVEVRDGAVVRA